MAFVRARHKWMRLLSQTPSKQPRFGGVFCALWLVRAIVSGACKDVEHRAGQGSEKGKVMSTVIKQGLTNHVTLVLDRSGSMAGKERAVIKAVDAQITSLAEMSKKMDQETRVTVVIFDEVVDVLVYDKDVLRLPSISEYYEPRGMTALVDATLKSIEDLKKIPELYSDHAYLLFVVTDGAENRSQNTPSALSRTVQGLKDNWTVAALVPDMRGEQYAIKCGFPPGNILQWDTTSAAGFDKAASHIQQATSTFMQNRAAGVRSSRSVFSTDASTVNSATIQQAGLTPLDTNSYHLVHVTNDSVMRNLKIKDWVEKEAGHRYVIGNAYYELTKTEKIQPQKRIAVLNKKTQRIYAGQEARDLIGLPSMEVRVKPDFNPEFSIFVQSTSTNRHLVGNTKILLMV